MHTTGAPQPVIRDLARLVESEALGEAFFGAAADRSATEQEQQTWQALRDLEIRTNAGVSCFLARSGLQVSDTNRTATTVGSWGAKGLRFIPYTSSLSLVRQGTKRYLPAFQRLAAHYCGTDEAAFFNYVVQHELAIISVTTDTLAAQRGALDPVLRLLDEPVPGLGSSC